MTATLDILERLVGFDTVSARSNLGMVAYLSDFLQSRGFAVHRIADETGTKAGLFARIGPPGAGVLLSGHTDVVPVEGQDWTRDPFRLTRDGARVYGRGTTDMKGFLASALAMADRAARRELSEPLKLALSYDEEVGCIGMKHMIGALDRTIGLPRACIVGEPTEMQVAIGHKGKAALKAIFRGQNGHSALAPRFVNALHLAGDFMAALRGLQDEIAETGARDAAYDIPYSTLHIGALSGGRALNMVPERAEMLFEFRHLAADRAEDLMARIEAAAEAVAQSYQPRFAGAAIDITCTNAYPGLDTPPDAEVVGWAQAMAGGTAMTKVPFGTEAGLFAGLGIPVVVCGPGCMETDGHMPDESIALDQLATCDAMMDRILAEVST